MDAYLLDTNVVSALYDARKATHAAARAFIGALPAEAPQLISVITIAELRYGLALSAAAGQPLSFIEACIQRAELHPLAEIQQHTPRSFASVKSRLAIARIDLSRRLPRWVDQWKDRVTAQMLQIDEHDLWLAAQAIERNYVVVTDDTDFANVIGPVVSELRLAVI